MMSWFRGRGAPAVRARRGVVAASEVVIVVISLVYVVTGDVASLLIWSLLVSLFLSIGLVRVWRGRAAPAPTNRRWPWVLPVLSSLSGINSAFLALLARGSESLADWAMAVVAAYSIMLSWCLLQVGFAHAYQDAYAKAGGGLEFPGGEPPTFLGFLYFSFTLGSSFATSDVNVTSDRLRRLALVHSIMGFLYNAIVVAVAFQVLQQFAT